MSRGILYYNQGKYNLAEKDYNKAIVLNSRYTKAYINRGILFKKLGEYNLAEKDYTKAIELNRNLTRTS